MSQSAAEVDQELERIAASPVEDETTSRTRGTLRAASFRWIAGLPLLGLCLFLIVLVSMNPADNGSNSGPPNEGRETPPPAAEAQARLPAGASPSLDVIDQNVDPNEPIWAVRLDGQDDAVWSPLIKDLETADWTFEASVTPLSTKKGSIVWIGSPYRAHLTILFGKTSISSSCEIANRVLFPGTTFLSLRENASISRPFMMIAK